MKLFKTVGIFIFILWTTLIQQDCFNCDLFAGENQNYLLSESNWVTVNNDTIPQDIPPINVQKYGDPSGGYFFMSTNPEQAINNEYSNYNLIIDNDGNVKAFKIIGKDLDRIPTYFMQSTNGMLVHTEKSVNQSTVFVSDTAMAKQDSIENNTTTLNYQPYLELLPNGHFLKVNYSQDYMDLSEIIENGNPNTLITSAEIFELDKNKKPVFYWRSLDYFNINDFYSLPEKYEDNMDIGYLDINSIENDYDGNILLSSKNLSEITKISRTTGDIIWRLGGKNNEFNFINENEENSPNYFSGQHDIRRLSNGNITLFDNGVFRTNNYSRGVEYKIDELNKTATMIWEYRHSPDIFSSSNGSVQRLKTGNTVISWGDATFGGSTALTEVDTNKNTVIEMNLPFGYGSSQITKYPWAYSSPSGKVSFEILKGNTYNFNKGSQITCTKMKINDLQEIFYPMIFVNKYFFAPLNPEFVDNQAPVVYPIRLLVTVRGLISVDVEARFNLSCLGINYNTQEWKVYRRDKPGTGVFEQLETTYDENTGELVINTSDFGEFIFGLPQQEIESGETLLIYPKNDAKLSQNTTVKLSWSPHGYFTGCNLQIAKDKDFNQILVDTNYLQAVNYNFENLESESTYWWRVRLVNGDKNGDWSDSRFFSTVPSFIDIKVPDGGEKWYRDLSRKIIRWDKNETDNVKIELYKGGLLYHVIIDSLFSPTGGFSWVIPDFIPFDTDYKIRVISLKNNELLNESSDFFSIADPNTGIHFIGGNLSGYNLEQNFPNPFSDITEIGFQIPYRGKVTLNVFNVIGDKVATIIDNELAEGSYKINWNASHLISGQYYYRLQFGGLSLTKTMTVVN